MNWRAGASDQPHEGGADSYGLDYSLQNNRKTAEGADHPDWDAQFRHSNLKGKRLLRVNLPMISVDTKKKELIGNCHNHRQ